MLNKRNQKGFTLIEIIAVLVILGILAAVAIPKYFNMQATARVKAVQGALGALQSTATQHYAMGLLNGTFSANSWTVPGSQPINVGDFSGTIAGTNGAVTITVTSGSQTGWSDGIGANNTKTFNIW
jgi:prepilin-type N-terminal cleavage/methylation domain-containing protein